MLEILYQDKHLVAINKPHGLLVHRTKIANDADEFALQILRDQLGQTVYPAHRLDRKTGGILLFSLTKEMDQLIQTAFGNQEISKKYLAILRGYAPESGTIDYDLTKDNGTVQNAITHYRTLQHVEIPFPQGKFDSARFSLIEAQPETGRFHQLRKHFAHLRHPIIGDRPHGCNKQNKWWKETFEMESMMLHASELEFNHPITKEKITIKAKPQAEFIRVCELLKIDDTNY
jgi:tRNA pseudouridine65 synthase